MRTIYDDATRLGPPPQFHLTPSGVLVTRGRCPLTIEQLAKLTPFHIDGFAGGGGASEGYYLATGRHADMAWNHDREAIAMHTVNHAFTKHFCEDIRTVPWAKVIWWLVTSAHFSPDCRDFSKAKGGKPKSKQIRGLAWTIVHLINQLGPLAPLVITMENVEEFLEWCPLLPDGTRNKKLLGWFFRCFVGALQRRGYEVEWRELRASDWSRSPTIRKRLYLIARRDGQPIVFPTAREESPRVAADILDFSLPCPSIFLNKAQARKIGVKRPLVKATCRRLAKGVERYVMKSTRPFLVNLTHQGNDGVEDIGEPMKTVTAANRGEKALVAPVLAYGQHGGAVRDVRAPMHTVTASKKDTNTLAAVHLARQFGTGIGTDAREPMRSVMANGGGGKTQMVAVSLTKFHSGSVGSAATEPVPTVVAGSYHKRPGGTVPIGVEAVFLAQHNGGMVGHECGVPVSTIAAKGSNQAVVSCGLVPYFGSEKDACDVRDPLRTVTTRDRYGHAEATLRVPLMTLEMAEQARRVARFLRRHGVKVEGEFAMCGEFVIVDIGMRMLTPRELYRAQGFGEDYIIDRGILEDGTEIKLTKTAQVRMCGNSVCPPMAELLFRLNLPAPHLMKAAA